MSTPNFKTQQHFDLYATNNFLSYPYAIDPNTDDFLLDNNGEYVIDYDAEPYFDNSYFDECKKYTDKLNARLDFFNIDFEDGHYTGVQTYINTQTSDFDALDFLAHPQYYDSSELFAEFGYNTYILKRKILAEIKHINNDLLPELARMYNFDKLHIVAQFSNGETIYAKENN